MRLSIQNLKVLQAQVKELKRQNVALDSRIESAEKRADAAESREASSKKEC